VSRADSNSNTQIQPKKVVDDDCQQQKGNAIMGNVSACREAQSKQYNERNVTWE